MRTSTRVVTVAAGALAAYLLLVLLAHAAGAVSGLPAGSAPLEVGIHANVTSGRAPLSVQFVAVIRGGTGTYPSISWAIGPNASALGAEVNYTFPTGCECLVTVNVTDSSEVHATASTVILVGSPSPRITPAAPPAAIVPIGILAAASGAGFGVGLVSWTVGRSDGPDRARSRGPSLPGPGVLPPLPPVGSGGEASADLATGAAAVPGLATLRLSERVILHLARVPAVGPYDVAGAGRTQAGIVARFGSSQSAVSNVLARLAAAEVVVALTRHVAGEKRRRKVYLLTPYGEALAKGLAARQGGGRPAAVAIAPGSRERLAPTTSYDRVAK